MKEDEIEIVFDAEDLNDFNGMEIDVDINNNFVDVTVTLEEPNK